MNYILKHFDTNLIEFRFIKEPLSGTKIEIIREYDEHEALFPLALQQLSLLAWIKARTIPKNRDFVHKILMELELNFDDIEGIVSISKSLSLNDSYWIVKKDFEGSFDAYNLYDNDFNKTLALLAYTGYASVQKSEFISSPEFTTNGMLAKAWRKNPRGKEGIYLYKSGSKGFANSGKEPYSEFYAYQVAHTMGLDITPYHLGRWKGNLNSICEIFSSKKLSFVPIAHLVTSGGWQAVFEYYQSLGGSHYQDLVDMLIFDCVIVNTDRHFGNFGLIVDTQSNAIIQNAPIFDNGLSLFYDALEDDLESIEKYAKTKIMKNSGDFMVFARSIITPQSKKRLKKLINFRFRRDKTYNLPAKRLKQIEAFIQVRVRELLKMEVNR
ncbi:MAG: HipA domain-containing protein [Campylobacterota bacterium]|nr:HipA domain-containing protein [Campylobacterota bacterium]